MKLLQKNYDRERVSVMDHGDPSKNTPTDERSSVLEEEHLGDPASLPACSWPADLTLTLLPLPVQGHARAMAPAGNVGGGGGGAAETAGTG